MNKKKDSTRICYKKYYRFNISKVKYFSEVIIFHLFSPYMYFTKEKLGFYEIEICNF